MRLRKANPASPSLIDPTAAPVEPAPFTPEQRAHAVVVLRGLLVGDRMGIPEQELVREAAARLRGRRVVAL